MFAAACTPPAEGNGTYSFPSVELVYSSPGEYKLVVVADSIASSLSDGSVLVRYKGSATTWQKIQSYLIVSGLFLLVSRLHANLRAVPTLHTHTLAHIHAHTLASRCNSKCNPNPC